MNEEESLENSNAEDETQEKSDVVLEKGYLDGLVEQADRVVYYEIENIYKDEKNKEYKNKYKMKKSPPILTVKNNLGDEVQFELTKNLTSELISVLKEVDRAHLGFSGPIDINVPTNPIDKIVYYAKKNPLKFAIPIIMAIFFLILSIM